MLALQHFLLTALVVFGSFGRGGWQEQLTALKANDIAATADATTQTAQVIRANCQNIQKQSRLKSVNLDVLIDLVERIEGVARATGVYQDPNFFKGLKKQFDINELKLSNLTQVYRDFCSDVIPDPQALSAYQLTGVATTIESLAAELPTTSAWLKPQSSQVTYFISSDRKLIDEGYVAGGRRELIQLKDIPLGLQWAVLAAEDKNFFEHDGIDYNGIFRAAQNTIMQNRTQGGSTLSQQLIKNLYYVGEARTLEIKIKEAMLTQNLENDVQLGLTKEARKKKILEAYLNIVPLGAGIRGVGLAARKYFNKPVQKLSWQEAATLAGAIRQPRLLTRRDQVPLEERRNQVLDAMLEFAPSLVPKQKLESYKEQIAKSRDSALKLRSVQDFHHLNHRYVTDLVKKSDLIDIEKGGYQIHVTANSILQDYVSYELQQGLVRYETELASIHSKTSSRNLYRGPVAHKVENREDFWNLAHPAPNTGWFLGWVQGRKKQQLEMELDDGRSVLASAIPGWRDRIKNQDVVLVDEIKPNEFVVRQVPQVQGAAVVMDIWTGAVYALSGGFDYKISNYNRSNSLRQPGSTAKIFTYIAALQQGWQPSVLVPDSPKAFCGTKRGEKKWRPRNYTGNSYPVERSMRIGIEESRNLMTAHLMEAVGLDNVLNVMTDFGFYDLPGDHCSAVIGGIDTTLLHVATAYARIANGGIKVSPQLVRSVYSQQGKSLYQNLVAAQIERVTTADSIALLQARHFLNGVVTRGTAAERFKDISEFIAGKTGTTNSHRDAWFVGFSNRFVAAVYVGYDEDKDLGPGMTGSNVAAPIFEKILKAAHTVFDVSWEPIITNSEVKEAFGSRITEGWVNTWTGEMLIDENQDAVPPVNDAQQTDWSRDWIRRPQDANSDWSFVDPSDQPPLKVVYPAMPPPVLGSPPVFVELSY